MVIDDPVPHSRASGPPESGPPGSELPAAEPPGAEPPVLDSPVAAVTGRRGRPLRRRLLLAGVPATAATAALVAGAGPGGAPAAAGAPGVNDDVVQQGFNALAAFVAPGDDAYSVRQGLTRPGPGGVANGAAAVLADTYDRAVQVAVTPWFGVTAPGAGGVALVLATFTTGRYQGRADGPFAHPFANIPWRWKAQVLADLDTQWILQGTPLGYAFGTFATVAALACYSEGSAWTGGRLVERPVGWRMSGYAGISDGWAQYRGYWAGNRAAADPDD